jgi:diguanylate cyclase (GGDEF)-like protein
LVLKSGILAVVACFLVLVVVNVTQPISPFFYGYTLVAAFACYLTYRATKTDQLWLTDLLLVCTTTACLGSVANAVGNPLFWFVPIGLMMSLPVSAMHVRPWHATFTGAAVWATLFAVVQPHFARDLDLTLTLILVAASMLVAMLVCQTFCQIRKNVFDLERQLHDMAYKDTLTTLPNRRAFMEKLTATVTNNTTPAPLFFLMLDIDDFKKINDGFGHDVGDRVLVEVAKVLNDQSVGHSLARLGGEEFAVAAQVENAAAAQELAQGIVDAVNSNQLHGLNLSISVGLAARGPGEPLFSLMRRADQALYEAKRDGKNRYAVAAEVASAL